MASTPASSKRAPATPAAPSMRGFDQPRPWTEAERRAALERAGDAEGRAILGSVVSAGLGLFGLDLVVFGATPGAIAAGGLLLVATAYGARFSWRQASLARALGRAAYDGAPPPDET
jgi:hypothetical protein